MVCVIMVCVIMGGMGSLQDRPFSTWGQDKMAAILHFQILLSEKKSFVLMEHAFKSWLGALRQQHVTLNNVDPVPGCLMASLSVNELKSMLKLGCITM